ncbi:hypothetical protein AVEN_59726-1 [Araneus ventricosus]|uniref:F-box domain-containing protein n=1 Tax=Araneus ventricosus TaxID=182803 RepID=A0A4Y2BMT7_ARAVE|nr:hypothetical protein AVEN_59726-1 [Araneus ventricosus]
MMGCFPSKRDPTYRLLHDERTEKSMSSRETEEQKEGQWCYLPSPVLAKIYSFANSEEKLNMSLVCRKWSEEFCLTSVCKTFKFALTKSQLTRKNCLEKLKRFVQKHSRMFQHVEIECTYCWKKKLAKTWCRNFIVFIKILTNNSQLYSVKFQDLSHCIDYTDSPTYDDMCRTIADFLGSQYHLKRAVFRNCYFRFPEGVELLRRLTENCRESLSHIVLHKFEEQDSTAAQNLPSLVDLPSLTTLEIDYSLIFEKLIDVARQSTANQTVKNCQTLVLSKIILHCEYVDIRKVRGLTSTDWQFMKILCPDLQVELILRTYFSYPTDLEFFIAPCMPITRLEYSMIDPDRYSGKLRADVFCSHLLACKTEKHLVSLLLETHSPILDLAPTFIPFLQACKKLKCFVFKVLYESSGIDLLMKSWLDNRPESLEEVRIYITKIRRGDDYTTLINLTTEYVTRLKFAGLNIRVFYKRIDQTIIHVSQ